MQQRPSSTGVIQQQQQPQQHMQMAQQQQSSGAQHQQRTVQEYQQAGESAESRAPQTTALMGDFNLVAEAAKRAQVACLMRDLDEMDLA